VLIKYYLDLKKKWLQEKRNVLFVPYFYDTLKNKVSKITIKEIKYSTVVVIFSIL
jgi:hypothetical protein